MRIIFITGVSRGLGYSLSKALESNDTRVIGFGRSKGNFTENFHTCDFANPEQAANELNNGLNVDDLEHASEVIFISNAGILGQLAKAQDLSSSDIQEAITANLIGASIAASAFLKRVQNLDTQKLFIQISSGAALPDRAKASWSLYCACKAGQEQLIRSIALEQETAKYPTKLININPGVMETAMQAQLRKTPKENFPDVAKFIKMSEEGKIPSPDTIAKRIAVLIENPQTLENGKTHTLAQY